MGRRRGGTFCNKKKQERQSIWCIYIPEDKHTKSNRDREKNTGRVRMYKF